MPAPRRSRDPSADLDFAVFLESLSDLSLCESISQSELDHLVEGIEELGMHQEIPEGEMNKLLDILGELCIRVSKPVPLEEEPSKPESTEPALAAPPIDTPASVPVTIPPPQNVDMSAADEIRHHMWTAHQAIPDPATMVWPNPCNCGMKVTMADKQEVCWHILTYSWVCPYCLRAVRLDMGRGEYELPRTGYVLYFPLSFSC